MTTFQIGDVARLCRIPRSRVDKWVRRGFLRAEPGPSGTGHHKTFSVQELAVAKAVAAMAQKYRVIVTAATFASMRARLEEEDHNGNGDR